MLTLIGAALLGLGSALIIALVPAALGARHPRFTTAALGEANAVSSFASLLAPAAVAGAIGLGVGWAAGYLLPVLPVAVALLVVLLLQRRDWEQTSDAAGPAVRADPRPGTGARPTAPPLDRAAARGQRGVLPGLLGRRRLHRMARRRTRPPLRCSPRCSCSAWPWSARRPPGSPPAGIRRW